MSTEGPTLPPELVTAILSLLPTHTFTSIRTLLAFSLASRASFDLASQSSLWDAHLHARWPSSRPAPSHAKQAYIHRHLLDTETSRTLDRLTSTPQGRIPAADRWLCEVGPLGRERLRALICAPVQDELQPWFERDARGVWRGFEEEGEGEVKEDALCRRYWAQEMLGLLGRAEAMKVWARVARGEDVSFEEGIASLSVFRGAEMGEVTSTLDSLAEACAAWPGYASVPADDIPGRCEAIVRFMESEGFGPPEDNEYHAMAGHYLHLVLTTHKRTLPMTLCCVFVSLARRLGLDAHPANLPGHLICTVLGTLPSPTPPSSSSPPITLPEPQHVDPSQRFQRASPLIPRPLLLSLLPALGSPDPSLLGPAPTMQMLFRAALNIRHSIRADARTPEGDLMEAVYLSSVALYRLGPALAGGGLGAREPRGALEWLAGVLAERFVLDVGMVEREMAVGDELCTGLAYAGQFEAAREEDEEMPVPRRREEGAVIRFKVGQMFQHRRFLYTAVIIGWSETCDQSEAWIQQMGVDRLARGRHQPFYHVLVAQDGSARYVAEENVVLLSSLGRAFEPEEAARLVRERREVGRWFGRWQAGEGVMGRWVLGREGREIWPDDVELDGEGE